jgi:hypothetical protein
MAIALPENGVTCKSRLQPMPRRINRSYADIATDNAGCAMLKVIAVFGLALLSLATSYAIFTYWPENPAPQAQRAATP